MTKQREFALLLSSSVIAAVFFGSCLPTSFIGRDKEIVVSINNYNLTRNEFETEFKASPFGKADTSESRKEFLNNLIDRRLIIQYAQKEELDKEKDFLKMIERFWEQSLLKIALDKKTKEIGRKTSVTDGEINRAYYDMSKKGEVSEPLGQVYKRIRWELTRAKEAEMMDEWMAEMHKKTRIFVNKDILKE